MKPIQPLSICILFLYFSSTMCSLFYELKSNVPRCYIEDLFSESVMMLKWKVFTKKKSDATLYASQITININSEDTNEELFKHILNSVKSKTSFSPYKEGSYRVCVLFKGRNPPSDDALYINLRFGSDNMDEPDINKALKEKDINEIYRKMNQVVELGKPIIDSQKQEIEKENVNAEQTLKSTKWYKVMAFIQIALCILIGLFQLNNFRKFLRSQNII